MSIWEQEKISAKGFLLILSLLLFTIIYVPLMIFLNHGNLGLDDLKEYITIAIMIIAMNIGIYIMEEMGWA